MISPFLPVSSKPATGADQPLSARRPNETVEKVYT
jgi:hypothetical protein